MSMGGGGENLKKKGLSVEKVGGGTITTGGNREKSRLSEVGKEKKNGRSVWGGYP